MSKHTPGPWTYENDEESLEQWNIISPQTDNHDVVATVPKTGDEDYDNETIFANACLIAAAPEMFTILTAIEEWMQQGGSPGPSSMIFDSDETLHGAIRNVIAKAKGY